MAKTSLLGGGGQTPPIFSDPGSVFRRGEGGILPERGSRAQLDMVSELLRGGIAASQGSGSPLLAFLAPMVGGAVGTRTQGLYGTAQEGRDQQAIDQLLAAMGGAPTQGGVAPGMTVPAVSPTARRNAALRANGGPTNDAAAALADSFTAPAVDAATITEGLVQRGLPQHIAEAFVVNMQDESGLNPGINEVSPLVPGSRGGFGLYQLTGPRRVAYEQFAAQRGVDPSNVDAQLDFLMLELQGPESRAASSILAAPDKATAAQAIVNDFLRPAPEHRARRTQQYAQLDRSGSPGTLPAGGSEARALAARVAGGDFSALAGAGQGGSLDQNDMRVLMGLMTNGEISQPLRDLASTMISGAVSDRGGLSPQEQVSLASGLLGLEQALQPAPSNRFRPATPDEARAFGAEAGQIGPDGRFYPAKAEADNANAEAGVLRQRNEATQIIAKAIETMTARGMTQEEAMASIARDPIYGPQLQILGIDPKDLVPAAPVAPPAAAPGPGFWERLMGGGGAATPPVAAPAPVDDPLGIR